MLKKIKTWWKQRICEHFWRPGRRDTGSLWHPRFTYFKVCEDCKKEIELTEAEFYAIFGSMPPR